MNESTSFLLQAFDHALDQVQSGAYEVKQEAAKMTAATGALPESPLRVIYETFLMGVNEGMNIEKALERGWAWQQRLYTICK